MPILILDASRQVDHILMLHTLVISQLCVQHRFTVGPLPLKIDIGCIVGEVLGAPREFSYRASLAFDLSIVESFLGFLGAMGMHNSVSLGCFQTSGAAPLNLAMHVQGPTDELG